MQLEDYFEFEKFDSPNGPIERIRINGGRIALEHVVRPFLKGDSAERIFQNYRRSMRLEDVYAAITYYLHNTPQVDEYLAQGRALEESLYQEHLAKEPPAVVQRMRGLVQSRIAVGQR